MEEKSNNRTLGVVFLALGFTLSTSLAITLGPAFIGVGAAFFVLGIVFLNKDEDEESNDG